jgi:hypothetical protein
VACWSSAEDDGYTLNRRIEAAAVTGRTETVLSSARAGLWDRGAALRVKLFSGSLSSASEFAVLNGANAMAIGDGSTDRWEVLQFAEATLVAPRTYDLTLRLRGQLGTDALMPATWPVGSRIVLLNDAVQQIRLSPQARGLDRHYRIGIAARGTDDLSVVHRILAFDGAGLRPYAPVHLKASVAAGGDATFRWVRRTRLVGDGWQQAEVPLGEDGESYLIRVIRASILRREETVTARTWTYTGSAQVADGTSGLYRVEVAQISDRYGPGLFRTLSLTA